MLVKGIIGSILLIGVLGTHAYDNNERSHENSGERLDLMKHEGASYEQKKPHHEFHNKKMHKEYKKDGKFQNKKEWNENSKEYKKERKHQYGKEYYKKDAKQQFEKDYKHWNKQMKHNHSLEKQNNEEKAIPEYVDKYNRYGKTFDPNLVNKHNKKHKEGPHDKHYDHEKPKTLLYDTDVNYAKSHENLEGESELINGQLDKPRSLLHDTEINYVKGSKKIEGESEVISGSSRAPLINKERYEENYQNREKIFEKRHKKNFLDNLKAIDLSTPPVNDTVMLARYIVHSVDWASMATLTSRNSPSGLSPFACVKSMSDGEINSSSGIPFFYMSDLDLCTSDLKKNNKVSLLITLSQTDYCKTKSYDPQDPRCAKIMMTGRITWLEPETEEGKFAQKAMFSRHPIMKNWPTDHTWKFAKMDMDQILLLYRFGGAEKINIKDYFNAQIIKPVNAETPTP